MNFVHGNGTPEEEVKVGMCVTEITRECMIFHLLVKCGSKLRMKELEEVIRIGEQVAHKRKRRSEKYTVHVHFKYIYIHFLIFIHSAVFLF